MNNANNNAEESLNDRHERKLRLHSEATERRQTVLDNITKLIAYQLIAKGETDVKVRENMGHHLGALRKLDCGAVCIHLTCDATSALSYKLEDSKLQVEILEYTLKGAERTRTYKVDKDGDCNINKIVDFIFNSLITHRVRRDRDLRLAKVAENVRRDFKEADTMVKQALADHNLEGESALGFAVVEDFDCRSGRICGAHLKLRLPKDSNKARELIHAIAKQLSLL